jgi:hypothetical protein
MSVRAANNCPKKSTFTSGGDRRSTGPGGASKKPVCTGPGGAACFGVNSSRRNNRAFSACNRAPSARRLATSSASPDTSADQRSLSTPHTVERDARAEPPRSTTPARLSVAAVH